MQRKMAEAMEGILATTPVLAANAAHESAAAQASKLKASQAALVARAKRLLENVQHAGTAVEDALIDGEETADLAHLTALEFEHRMVTRANLRIVEHLLPQAEIAELSRSAEFFVAQARALRAEAHQRMQKTAELMADAAAFEGHITFSPEHTLSGALQAQAAEFDRQADNARRWAAERTERYEKIVRDLGAIQR